MTFPPSFPQQRGIFMYFPDFPSFSLNFLKHALKQRFHQLGGGGVEEKPGWLGKAEFSHSHGSPNPIPMRSIFFFLTSGEAFLQLGF